MLPLVVLVAVLGASAPQAAHSARDTRAPAARGAISGRITDKDSGRPVPRAIVWLQAEGASEARPAVADAQGRYAFTNVEAGKYAVWAGPGELVATHLGQAYGQAAPLVPGAVPRASLRIVAGESLTRLDIALPRALAIEGRVSDPWDDPIADAEVIVSRADGASVFAMAASTDDRGEYRLYGLAPGRYRVCATAQYGFPPSPESGSRSVRTCHLAAIAESNAADVLLDGTDATGIDIRMQRTGTWSAAGSVVDADGAAVDGAFVAASRDDQQGGADATTHEGQFTLTGLTPGRYRVHASIGGRATPDDPRPPAREREWGYTTMEIDSGDISNVVVTITKPQRVSGRVVFEGPRPTGSLHMAVQMGSEPEMWGAFGRPPVGAVDDRLAFEVGDLYRAPVMVHLQGVPDGWIVRSVRYGDRDITDQFVEFDAESAERPLEIRLTNHVARPRVRVTADDGRPADGSLVVIMPADPARVKAMRLGAPERPRNDGLVGLGPTLPGEYLLAALSPEDVAVLMRERERVEALRASARRVTILEGDEQTIDLPLTRLPAKRQ